MAKRTSHYDLDQVKATVAALGQKCFTRSALDGLAELDLTPAEALKVIASLTAGSFYKTIPAQHDATLFQDVYRPDTPNGPAYLKFMLAQPEGFATLRVVISFKPL